MNKSNTVRRLVDACMTVLLLCLMAYQVTGETLHEWIGIGMTALLILHHILNIRWYSVLSRGRYTVYRTVTTAVNMLLLAAISLTALCGMAMSGHAVPFLYGMLPVSLARQFHLAMSYWSFILMGVHLGLHVPAMAAGFRWSGTVKTALAVWAAAVAGVGFFLFAKSGISDYIFFRSPFAFLDYDKSAISVFAENAAMLIAFAFLGGACASLLRGRRKVLPILLAVMAASICAGLMFLTTEKPESDAWAEPAGQEESSEPVQNEPEPKAQVSTFDHLDDGFILLEGGTFLMGSPETENWRIDDEAQREVTLSPFYIDPYETTQKDYERLMGESPGSFTGEDLPVESISWLDAVRYANARSADAGLTPAYAVEGDDVTWNRSADGYRLPTEAEWEYACRAGTITPFNTEKSLDAEEANFYGHYPYEIEENYFNSSVLEARPGQYRQTTVPVGSFYESRWGLYDMHGNVNEWCWDWYGAYDPNDVTDPVGAEEGTRHVYRGGGWNDFAKNMRSAYRAAGQPDQKSANLGVRLVRSASPLDQTVTALWLTRRETNGGKTLIAFFSWGGNTRGVAREIRKQTGADLFEITLKEPYSSDYNTVLMQAQEDQHRQARPEINNLPESLDEYDVILLGYPNWWASIPMPIASFLEHYDLSGKTIVPFCSHGGGRFGQSLTAIAKLEPDALIGEGLSVHYSGGSALPDNVAAWLERNSITRQ